MSEVRGGLGIRELRFHMLEGDFKVRLRELGGITTAETWLMSQLQITVRLGSCAHNQLLQTSLQRRSAQR